LRGGRGGARYNSAGATERTHGELSTMAKGVEKPKTKNKDKLTIQEKQKKKKEKKESKGK
jgi:hypothetical protein